MPELEVDDLLDIVSDFEEEICHELLQRDVEVLGKAGDARYLLEHIAAAEYSMCRVAVLPAGRCDVTDRLDAPYLKRIRNLEDSMRKHRAHLKKESYQETLMVRLTICESFLEQMGLDEPYRQILKELRPRENSFDFGLDNALLADTLRQTAENSGRA